MTKYKILKHYESVLRDVEDVLGSGVTTNDQLDKLGYSIFKNDYLGTFSSDKMPKYIKNNQCFILNTDSSRSANKFGHWIGFYKLNGKTTNGKLYYYDSFARPKEKLSKYWKNKRMYSANKTDRDQSFEESDCGSRAMSFLVICRKYGLKAIDVI